MFLDKLMASNRVRRFAAPIATQIRRIPALKAVARHTRQITAGSTPKWVAGEETVDPELQVDFRGMIPPAFDGDVGFIAREDEELVPYFHRAIDMLGLKGRVFDPRASDFHSRVRAAPEKFFLCRPAYSTNTERQMFWEKIAPLYDDSDLVVFPRSRSLRIYESKRELSYFLEMNDIPHPETLVFYDAQEAIDYAKRCTLPQVLKTNTGSSADGVEIVKQRGKLLALVKDFFFRSYVKKSLMDHRDSDFGYAMLQQYISPVREFRVIKIGDSWFGHEKIPGKEEYMSGSGLNAWTPPSFELLDFCNDIASRSQFTVMCFDIFRSGDGPFLVNELQTWFGSYNNSQMYVDGVPGRYVRSNGTWRFEKGYFNVARSMALIITASIIDGYPQAA